MTLLTMDGVLALLPTGRFARIHKSYSVSLAHVDLIDRHQLHIAGKTLPLGESYRKTFLALIEHNSGR